MSRNMEAAWDELDALRKQNAELLAALKDTLHALRRYTKHFGVKSIDIVDADRKARALIASVEEGE
jgi:predicted RNA-binding protein with PIN domain